MCSCSRFRSSSSLGFVGIGPLRRLLSAPLRGVADVTFGTDLVLVGFLRVMVVGCVELLVRCEDVGI